MGMLGNQAADAIAPIEPHTVSSLINQGVGLVSRVTELAKRVSGVAGALGVAGPHQGEAKSGGPVPVAIGLHAIRANNDDLSARLAGIEIMLADIEQAVR